MPDRIFYCIIFYIEIIVIIKAKHNAIIDPFFRWYVIWKMKRSFHEIVINSDVEDLGKPILLICNHTSWWDGIWALHLNQQKFQRKFHFMMLEEQLKKNWFFQYTGGFSVRKSDRSVVESLNYAADLLENKNNLVLMFPQGKIQSMHRTGFIFEKGIERILKRTKNEVELVFEVNLLDYFSQVKPSVYLNATVYNGEHSLTAIQEAYNAFFLECIHQQEKKEV